MRKSLSSLPVCHQEQGQASQCGIRAPRINFTLMFSDGIWGHPDLKHMLAPTIYKFSNTDILKTDSN